MCVRVLLMSFVIEDGRIWSRYSRSCFLFMFSFYSRTGSYNADHSIKFNKGEDNVYLDLILVNRGTQRHQ